MGFPGIIENTFGSTLNIINCMFQDNVYGEENNFGVSTEKHMILSSFDAEMATLTNAFFAPPTAALRVRHS
jgi:hypothetical protein